MTSQREILPIYLTGIRSGETIIAIGKSKQNADSEMIVYGDYPPSRRALEELSKSQWISLLALLATLPTFVDFSEKEIKQWLLNNATDEHDLYLDDLDLQVRPISLSGTLFDGSLPVSKRELFLRPNKAPNGAWPLREIYEAIKPKNLGSRARHHTLVFRPSIWTLKTARPRVESYSGLVFDLDNHYLIDDTKKIKSGKNQEFVIFGPLAVLVTRHDSDLVSIDALLELVQQITGEDSALIAEIYQLLNWAPPSFHKSLMQKIIRTGTRKVSSGGISYPASAVLLVSFCTLFLHPGAFVPQLQTFVVGAEGALKRLAVTIFEDSYSSDSHGLLSLLVAALLVKQERMIWKECFTIELIEYWLRLALKALTSHRIYSYQTKKTADLSNTELSEPYHLCYLMLEELKSFHTDLNMLSWIAHDNGAHTKGEEMFDTMPLIHCVDQHVWPDLAYFCSWAPAWYEHTGDFVPLFVDIWRLSSGVNPRRKKDMDYWPTMEETPFIRKLRKSQGLLLLAKSPPGTIFPAEKKKIRKGVSAQIINGPRYKLEDAWIAGLVGPVLIKSGWRHFYVSIDCHDISERKVMLRPTRDKKMMATPISDEEKRDAIEKFDKLLKKGVPALSLPAVSWFNGSTIYGENEEYKIKFSGKNRAVSWSQKGRNSRPILEVIDDESKLRPSIRSSILMAAADRAQSISGVDGIERAVDLIRSCSPLIISRLLTYLSTSGSIIEFPAVGRLGKGTEYAVRMVDCYLYQLFCKLVCLVPFALQRAKKNVLKFQVCYGPFITQLREELHGEESFTTWPLIYKYWTEAKGRPLRQHQKEIVTALLEAHKPGHIIDVPVGGGKTAIVGEYVRLLALNGQMPPYLIYTLPSSAIDSVTKELQRFKFTINMLDIRKTSGQNIELIPHVVNLIRHDHLRSKLIAERLRIIAPEMLFVVDEFHFALNPTQRTTICLELARTSYCFVAMSGTPIKDTHTNYLIPWLEPVVSFEVTEENMWTAVAGMLSRRITLPIRVVEKKVEAVLSSADEVNCQNLMNSHDPSSLNKAFNICFAICLEKMVTLAISRIRKGHYVFLVAKNRSDQDKILEMCLARGLQKNEVYLITGDSPLTLEADDPRPIKLAVTTYRHSTGYTLSKMDIMITSVYFADETVRNQLVGRLVRLSQKSEKITVITVHAGILSEVLRRYEQVGSMALAQKSMAVEIDVTVADR